METLWKIVFDIVASALLGAITVMLANGTGHQHWSFLIVWVIWFLILGFGIVVFTISDGEIDLF